MYSKTIWQKRFAKALACGYGAGNIRAYAQTLTDKPVKYVINTTTTSTTRPMTPTSTPPS